MLGYQSLLLRNYLSSKPAYVVRLGQEPPPRPAEDVFDGRSLAEVRKSHMSSITVRLDLNHFPIETSCKQSKHDNVLTRSLVQETDAGQAAKQEEWEERNKLGRCSSQTS